MANRFERLLVMNTTLRTGDKRRSAKASWLGAPTRPCASARLCVAVEAWRAGDAHSELVRRSGFRAAHVGRLDQPPRLQRQVACEVGHNLRAALPV